jgi:hypothetical protein
MKFFIRRVLFAIAGIFLLELVLHFFSGDDNPQRSSVIRSFDRFFADWREKGVGKADLYFVGDSTVYGSGSSDHGLYALPSQFERLMRVIKPGFRVINLGYPGTCTEEHLQMMSLLPEGAMVIYRGGVSDIWNNGSPFRVHLGDIHFECRIWKMLAMLRNQFFPRRKSDKSRLVKIRREFEKIMQDKKFKLFTLDYTTAPFTDRSFPFFYRETGTVDNISLGHIPLRQLLKEGGYFGPNGLDDRFISFNARTHPNDLGYFLEAIFLVNFCCNESLFGLSKKNILSPERLTVFSSDLFHKYEQLKLILKKSLKPDDLLQKKLVDLYTIIPSLLSLSNTLRHQEIDTSEKYEKEHQMLKRLSIFLYQSSPNLAHYLMSLQEKYARAADNEKADRLHKAELYYAIMMAAVDADTENGEWVHLHRYIRNSFLPLNLRPVSRLPYISPYPLEFCCRFIRESGFSAEELSVRQEWEYFFALPFDIFLEGKNRPAACECSE